MLLLGAVRLWMSPGGKTAGTLKPGAPYWNGSKEKADANESVMKRASSEEKRGLSDGGGGGGAPLPLDVMTGACDGVGADVDDDVDAARGGAKDASVAAVPPPP